MATAEKPQTPAYCSFKSFNTFLDARREDGHVTDVVDRSLMTNFAGSTAGELLAALKYLGMLNDKGAPTELYVRYVPADSETRVPMLAGAMRAAYPFVFQTEGFNIERATSAQMAEQFRAQGVSGSTLTRAIMFFLAAARQAGIKVSPNIKAPLSTSNYVRRRTPVVPPVTSPPAVSPAPTSAVSSPAPSPDVQVFEIPIPIGRKVTIAIPNQFSAADWELFQTMLTAYVQHWKTQMSDLQKPTTTTETEDAG